MGLRILCVSGMLAFAGIAAAAPSQTPLEDARAAVEGSDYLAARAALDKALKAGGASPQDVAEIYKLSGIVEAALGNTDAASAAFARWLELDPKGALPAGTSPKIMRPWKAASDKAVAIAAKADTVAQPPSVTLTVTSDQQKLIAHAHVIVVADGGAPKQLDGEPGVAIKLPAGRRLDLQVQALDGNGNRVFELGSEAVPLVITGSDDGKTVVVRDDKKHPRPPEIEHPRSWYLQWYVWGGVAIASAAVSGVFAYETHQDLQQLDLLNRNSLDHTYGDAHAVESNARRDLLIANIAAGTAGFFALGTVILYMTRPHLEHSIAAVPTRDGGSIVFGGHF